MSRSQWGHGYHAGRMHEKISQKALQNMPRVLNKFFGAGNWFFDQSEKVYIATNPRHVGDGIGFICIDPDSGEWFTGSI